MLPITSKLLPFRARNLAYLAEVAALTRMTTGVVRVMENRPSQQKDDKLSQNEKRQALAERFFVEIVGTAGYMAFLHLGQDLADKVQACLDKTPIPQIDHKNIPAKIQESLNKLNLHVNDFNALIEKLYCPESTGPKCKLQDKRSGLIYRVLYENEKTGKKATLGNLQTLVQEKALTLTQTPDSSAIANEVKQLLTHFEDLEKFATRNNVWAAGAILTGVLMSATVGGSVTQWMNDNLIGPGAKELLKKRFANGQAKPAPKTVTPIAATLASQQPLVQTANPALAQNAVNPFNFAAINAPLPPNPPPHTPVYLPNPKMQPPAAAFAANALPKPYSTPLPSPMFGGRP